MEKPAPEITEEKKRQRILSCIEKGYSLNHLTINWEARDLRYANK